MAVIELLLISVLCVGVQAVDVEVVTEWGPVLGVARSNVTAFFAIPFAKPPMGDRRFKNPEAPQAWSEPLNCTEDLPFRFCPQLSLPNVTIFGTEDCLHVNIYVPKSEPPVGGFPVMFWIYGGAFVFGKITDRNVYRGQNLAALREVIVVEANYRLGPLGFLALPELMAESEFASTGNYGNQDQQAALAFTYRNIEKFTGNPNKITIFGESAGAISVCWHMVSNISRRYFSSAIMESGSCSSPEFFAPLSQSYKTGQIMTSFAKCEGPDVLACLRAQPLPSLYIPNYAWTAPNAPPLAPLIPYGPTIDGSVHGLTARPIDLLEQGAFPPIPLIIGTNLDEGTIFRLLIPFTVPEAPLPLNETTLAIALQHFFNDSTVQAILTMYPESLGTADIRVDLILRDMFFACPSRRVARAVSSHNAPTYLYQFVQELPNRLDYDIFGDYHSIEIAFVFNNPGKQRPFNAIEQLLSNIITGYWSNLARGSNPNGPVLPVWPAYNASTDENIFLEVFPSTGTGLLKNVCDFWDVHYAKYYFDK